MSATCEVQALLERLKGRYPHLEFQRNPETGMIEFVANGMMIYDPWLSDCGRFHADPRDYGLRLQDAINLKAFNLPIENAMALQDAEESGAFGHDGYRA